MLYYLYTPTGTHEMIRIIAVIRVIVDAYSPATGSVNKFYAPVRIDFDCNADMTDLVSRAMTAEKDKISGPDIAPRDFFALQKL